MVAVLSKGNYPGARDLTFRYYTDVINAFGEPLHEHSSLETYIIAPSLVSPEPRDQARFYCSHWDGITLVEDLLTSQDYWIVESESMRLWSLLNHPPEARIIHG